MYSQDLLDEIRNRLPISQVVGERLALKKAGRNFRGLCPFHQEKTPSFMVSDEKQIYHCFGCGEGGNVFNFLMKVDGLTFLETVKTLAQRAGVLLPLLQKGEDKKDADWTRRKEWAFRLNTLAHQFFQENLADSKRGKSARSYLEKRGVSLEFAKEYGLGAADEEWESLVTFLKNRNAPLTLAAELGLTKKREGKEGYFDFFRNRILFPIHSHTGQVVAFGGRWIDQGKNDKEQAKYLNSPDSFLYSKSNSVFGLSWAKEEIRLKDSVIFVEGYLDALSLVQFGVKNVVAPLGTALTEGHVRLLSRFTRNFCVAFDGDEAGRKAAFRSLPLLISQKIKPKGLVLPLGEDPDDFIRKKGIEAWNEMEEKALLLFEVFVETTRKKYSENTDGQIRAWEEIKPVLGLIQDPVEYSLFKRKIAEELNLDEKWLGGMKQKREASLKNKENSKRPLEEKLMVASLLLNPSLKEEVSFDEVRAFFSDTELKMLAEKILESERECSLSSLPEGTPKDFEVWVREMGLLGEEEGESWERVFKDCLKKIGNRNKTNHLILLNKSIKEAETVKDEKQLLRLLGEKKRLMEVFK